MKKIVYLMLVAVLILPACKKTDDDILPATQTPPITLEAEQSKSEVNCLNSGGIFANNTCICPDETYEVNGVLEPLYALDEKGQCIDVAGLPGGKLGEEIKQNQADLMEENTREIEQGYNSESPEWEGFKTDIEKQTGELLESFSAPESPLNSEVIFISTSGEYTGEYPNGKQINKIYSYDTQAKTLTELYKEEEDRVLRTMGREGDKLVVLFDVIDNNPGPCASGWAKSYKYGTLNIEDAEAGLVDYTVPDYMIKKAETEGKKCQEEWSESSEVTP